MNALRKWDVYHTINTLQDPIFQQRIPNFLLILITFGKTSERKLEMSIHLRF